MKKALLTLLVVAFAASMCVAEGALVSFGAGDSSNSTQASGNTTTVTTQVSNTTVVNPVTVVPTSTTPAAPAGATTFIGKVTSMSSGSSITGENPQISVTDDNDQGMNFKVASGAIIIGKDGSPTTLDWIGGNKVNIEYTTDQDGAKTARSIKVLSDF